MPMLKPDPRAAGIVSPDGRLRVDLRVNPAGHLVYSVHRAKILILEESKLGIWLDGVNIGAGVSSGAPQISQVTDRFPSTAGVHAVAENSHALAVFPIRHTESGTEWTVECRVYDLGFAFRYIIPGAGKRRINGELTSWTFPEGATAWAQGGTENYEGVYSSSAVDQLKEWDLIAGPPMTVKLPAAAGYVSITEGALKHYCGMAVASQGDRTFRAVFPHEEKGWEHVGDITTPWRVTMVSPDLDGLVNNDIVEGVNPAPTPELVGADWIRPGRALWSWWSQNTGDEALQRHYVDRAAEFGFEYVLVDSGWDQWRRKDSKVSPWEIIRELAVYAKEKDVGIWIWVHWQKLGWPQVRDEFFKQAKASGVVGVKIDFMNSESVQMVDWYHTTLKAAADHLLMVNFHGVNKPTGLSRTWPNEMTREGVRGLEYNKFKNPAPLSHNAALPFTRCLAGPADYTPCTFNPDYLMGTTFAHQLAAGIVITAPLTHWAGNADLYAKNPAIDVMKTIPSTWDETRVLPGSDIGELAVFARRSGRNWFVGILNGGSERLVTVDFSSFLGGEKRAVYDAVFLKDHANKADAFEREEKTVRASDTAELTLRPGGGAVIRLIPAAALTRSASPRGPVFAFGSVAARRASHIDATPPNGNIASANNHIDFTCLRRQVPCSLDIAVQVAEQ